MKDIELYNDSFQNWKNKGIPKAQLILTDVPYNLGNNAYASNPTWYEGGDNKNGESAKAGKKFFSSENEFRPAEFMHFCSKMLIKEPKGTGKAPCMIMFCEFKQQFQFIELGRKCYGQYGRYSPLGSLVKMLLVSYQWYNPARRLKWDVQTICSMRISYTERSSNSRLIPSVKTLSIQDIPSNRLLFRLVPLEHPTEETGYGLLQDLIPTPITSDAQGGAVKLTRGKRLRNGQVFSATLKDLAASKMLPTPQTQGLKVCNKDGKTEFLNLELLPTPKAQEARGNCSVNRNKFNLTDKIAELTSPTSDASQLNPLFITEMMG